MASTLVGQRRTNSKGVQWIAVQAVGKLPIFAGASKKLPSCRLPQFPRQRAQAIAVLSIGEHRSSFTSWIIDWCNGVKSSPPGEGNCSPQLRPRKLAYNNFVQTSGELKRTQTSEFNLQLAPLQPARVAKVCVSTVFVARTRRPADRKPDAQQQASKMEKGGLAPWRHYHGKRKSTNWSRQCAPRRTPGPSSAERNAQRFRCCSDKELVRPSCALSTA
jgi:hypothetical protein